MDPDLDRRLAEAMRRAQDGERRAYEAMLAEVAALVREFVRKQGGQVDAPEDVVQETLLAVHRDRHTYDPARPFGPWMYAIARHRLLDHLRKQHRRRAREVVGDDAWDAATAMPAEDTNGGAMAFLQRAVERLSAKQRTVIQMLKLEGLSVAEIAQRTGDSESAVKVTAHRGYKILRRWIGRPPCEE